MKRARDEKQEAEEKKARMKRVHGEKQAAEEQENDVLVHDTSEEWKAFSMENKHLSPQDRDELWEKKKDEELTTRFMQEHEWYKCDRCGDHLPNTNQCLCPPLDW